MTKKFMRKQTRFAARRAASVTTLLTLLTLMLAGGLAAGQPPRRLSAITDPEHPEGDRTFIVRLKYGVDAARMAVNDPLELPVEVEWHGRHYPAQMSVTRLSHSVVKVKILWIAVEDCYYYPHATLRKIFIDRQMVGEAAQSVEGLDGVALVPLDKLAASAKDAALPQLNADMAKLNPNGRQVVVIEQSNLSQAFRAAVSLWDLGAAAVRKVRGAPKVLPAGRTEMAFTFLGIPGRPDMEAVPPKTLPVRPRLSR
jgi:hypothetical protein